MFCEIERVYQEPKRSGRFVNKQEDALEELRAKRETARLGGGLKRQEAIRSSGRGTALSLIHI